MQTFRFKGWRRAAVVAVAVAAFTVASVYIASTFAWGEMWRVLRSANWLVLGAGTVGSMIAFYATRAARWQQVIRLAGGRMSYRDAFRVAGSAAGLGLVTPLQAGELVKAELGLRLGSSSRSIGLGSIAVERLADSVVILAIGLVGLPGQTADFRGTHLLIAMFLAATALFAVALRVLRRIDPHSARVTSRKPGIAVLFVLTMAMWSVIAAGWFAAMSAVGVRIGYPRAVVLTALVTVANTLSLIPGGLGVSEAGIAVFLSRLGHESAVAQAGAVAVRIYGLIVLLGAVLPILDYRLGIRSLRSATTDH